MKKILTLVLAMIAVICTQVSCFSESFVRHGFFAMDTYITLEVKTDDTSLLKDAENMVYTDERLFSRTFAESGIYELNKSGSFDVGEETAAVIDFALEVSEKTDGAFNPCMGNLADLWNIKSETPKVPKADEIAAVLAECDTSRVEVCKSNVSLNGNLKLDLGGIAKGYSAQKITEHLQTCGVRDALVGFGGSIACIGSPGDGKKWKIGIKNPFDTSDIVGSVSVTDCYIAVSGAYERYFEQDGRRYHHILDPKSGYPAMSDIESSAVISKDGALADALSTALFVMGSERAANFHKSGVYDFEFILIKNDGEVLVSDGLSGSFEFNKDAIYNKEENLKLKYGN